MTTLGTRLDGAIAWLRYRLGRSDRQRWGLITERTTPLIYGHPGWVVDGGTIIEDMFWINTPAVGMECYHVGVWGGKHRFEAVGNL